VPDQNLHHRTLIVLLRLAGVVTLIAFLGMLLADWGATTRRWLGLGGFPRAPVVGYFMRAIAALYAIHGVLLFIVSRDPGRYRSIVRDLGWLNVIFGLSLVLIDVRAGTPLLWTVVKGAPIVAFGLVVLHLSRLR
jgi:hypothetical protein